MKYYTEYIFDIEFGRDNSAGLIAFHDRITIKVDSGDPGGEEGEFESYMKVVLTEWFDVATVTFRKKVRMAK